MLNILIYSPFFLPKIGGLENTVAAVALSYHRNGHIVRIITKTSLEDKNEIDVPYKIFRNPSFYCTLNLFKWANVIHQPNISLKGLFPLIFFRRTFCISHHTTNYSLNNSISFLGKLKYKIATLAHNSSCSTYTNSLLYKKGIVINSPYNEEQFYIIPNTKREKELVFLGRLVSDKGCNIIIEALSILKKKNIIMNFTIIGDGPEFLILQQLCIKYNVANQVCFKGSMTGLALNEELNNHKILIVPSIWEEPFGKVAVEGLASGCKVIVANSGGLPEAVGNLGVIFNKNDSLNLAEKIITTLESPPTDIQTLRNHLINFSINSIGKKYSEWIEDSYYFDLNKKKMKIKDAK